MRTKRSSKKSEYYLIQVTPVSDVQLMALLGQGVETVPTVRPTPVPIVKPPRKLKQTAKVKSGRGGARPEAGRELKIIPTVVEGATQHERVMKSVVKHLERGGPQRIVDLFEAVESSGSDEFGIRTNTPRRVRVNRFMSLVQREAVRPNARIVKRPYGIVALSRKSS